MSSHHINIANTIIAISTVIYTVGTFLLWRTTNKSVQKLDEQIEHQKSTSLSAAHHNVLDAHRSLFLNLITNDSLLKTYCGDDENIDEVRKNLLASALINHALRIFLDYENKLSFEEIDAYENDVRDLFSHPLVLKRWEQVKMFHPSAFRSFIDDKVLKSGGIIK